MSQDHPDTARKVVAAYFLSLDGVAEAPDQFITTWDDETDASGERLIATQDAVVLGRRTYDEWAGFWPGSEIQPFADFINVVPKYVATSTPLDGGWANSHVIDGDLVDFVRRLKAGRAATSASTAASRSPGRCSPPVSSTSSGSSSRRRSWGAGSACSTGCRPSGSRRSAASSPSGHLIVDYRVAH